MCLGDRFGGYVLGNPHSSENCLGGMGCTVSKTCSASTNPSCLKNGSRNPSDSYRFSNGQGYSFNQVNSDSYITRSLDFCVEGLLIQFPFLRIVRRLKPHSVGQVHDVAYISFECCFPLVVTIVAPNHKVFHPRFLSQSMSCNRKSSVVLTDSASLYQFRFPRTRHGRRRWFGPSRRLGVQAILWLLPINIRSYCDSRVNIGI